MLLFDTLIMKSPERSRQGIFYFCSLDPVPIKQKKENHGGTEFTKAHRVLLINSLNFVNLRDLVPLQQAQCKTLWRKKLFGVDSLLKLFISAKPACQKLVNPTHWKHEQ